MKSKERRDPSNVTPVMIGNAKEDLDRASAELNSDYYDINLKAYVTSLKAVVTQASSAIPVMPLYISLMYQVIVN